MALADLVLNNRSYRRFYQDRVVDMSTLTDLIGLARLTPSGGNIQPLKYALVNSPKMCAEMYPNVAWARYFKDWEGPEEGERPSAYVVMCNDDSLPHGTGPQDQGIAAQTILLGAVEKGLGGCMIGSFRKKEISELLDLPENFTPVMVIALGYPKEEVVITDIKNGDIKYYRDDKGVHYVPKRALDEIIIKKA